jgi:hypothetical protein
MVFDVDRLSNNQNLSIIFGETHFFKTTLATTMYFGSLLYCQRNETSKMLKVIYFMMML